MKTKKTDPLRTEAAIKRAVRVWVALQACVQEYSVEPHIVLEPTEIAFNSHGKTIAIADLRDLYRKRAPIKMKDLRKAIQPRRRAGK